MSIIFSPAAAWLCAAAGILAQALTLGRSLRRQGSKPGARWIPAMILPGGLALLAAWAGYYALQWGDRMTSFPWCYTTGLWGMIGGTALAARIIGARTGRTLDDTASGICLCMALCRLAQRWLGEAGIGPILDEPAIWTMVNDWEEPVLATWMIEALICGLAAGATLLFSRRRPKRSGGGLCFAAAAMLIPQILAEQFRSGAYLRFQMMRLEQALFALSILGILIFLGKEDGGRSFREPSNSRGITSRFPSGIQGSGAQEASNAEERKSQAADRRRTGKTWNWMTILIFLALCGGIALVQFLLDGKIFECPPAVSWTMYGLMICGMMALTVAAIRRRDRSSMNETIEEGSKS